MVRPTEKYGVFAAIFALSIFMTPTHGAPACQLSRTIQLKLDNCTILSADNKADVFSWGIRMGISGSEEICIVPSTVTNSTIFTATGLCDDSQLVDANQIQMTRNQCLSRRGGLVDTSKVTSVSTEGLRELNPGWIELAENIDSAASATLELDQDTITMIGPLVTKGQLLTQSHLGLASGATILQTLKDSGKIGARSWGLNSGSQSVVAPRSGSLVLGGSDGASRNGRFYDFPISNRLNGKRHCPLQVRVTSMTAIISNATETLPPEPIVQESDPMDVCIEPYDNLFRMPDTKVVLFTGLVQKFTGKSLDTIGVKDYQNELLNIEPGIVYPSDFGNFNISLRITINNSLTVEIPPHEFQRPLKGLDKTGKPVVDMEKTEMQIYGYTANEPQDSPVFGKAFLSQLYLFVDYETMTFHLANQNMDVSTPIPTSSAECTSSDSGGLSPAAKGLIGVGAVVGVLLLLVALLGYCFYKRVWRPSRENRRPITPPYVDPPTPDPPTTVDGGGHDGDIPLAPVPRNGGTVENNEPTRGTAAPNRTVPVLAEAAIVAGPQQEHAIPGNPVRIPVTSRPRPNSDPGEFA
ncbi:hypothetical protein V8F20_008929 [Naviculisporaceae sp. PSN 640]